METGECVKETTTRPKSRQQPQNIILSKELNKPQLLMSLENEIFNHQTTLYAMQMLNTPL